MFKNCFRFLILNFLMCFSFLCFSNSAWAQCADGQTFTCFDQADADKVFMDLTSAFAPTTVSGAGSLGKVFGVELGLVVSASKAPNTQEVVESYGSDFDIPGIPMAGISAVATMPMGFGIEGSFVPKLNLGDEASFESFNIGARWTVTDLFPMGVLKIALKTSVMQSKAAFSKEDDTGSPITGTVSETAEFNINILEIGAVLGLNLGFVEPYVGASDIRSEGTLHASGSSTGAIIIPDVDEASNSSGLRVYGGLVFKIPLMRIGAELSSFENIQRASVKIAFKF